LSEHRVYFLFGVTPCDNQRDQTICNLNEKMRFVSFADRAVFLEENNLLALS
jgi:hypothetical protein